MTRLSHLGGPSGGPSTRDAEADMPQYLVLLYEDEASYANADETVFKEVMDKALGAP